MLIRSFTPLGWLLLLTANCEATLRGSLLEDFLHGAELRSEAADHSRVLQTAKVVGDNGQPSANFPLGECEGDCDKDSDCESGLVCYQRNAGSSVPGCSSGTSIKNSPTDFCAKPSSSGGGSGGGSSSGSSTVTYRGNNGSPSSAFPLKKCEGDCDSDDDCAGNLVCFQRSGSQSVPGCSGGSSYKESHDFCVEPSSGGGGGGGSSSSSFYLKLYWEQGYYWQEESFERKWCLDCTGSGCDAGDSMIIVDCDKDSPTKLVFVFYGSEFQIQISGKNLCFELKSDKSIKLASCSSSSSVQRFIGQNGNPSGSGRFEIFPTTRSGYCLTQRHHPRHGETIQAETCSGARESDTSFWNKY